MVLCSLVYKGLAGGCNDLDILFFDLGDHDIAQRRQSDFYTPALHGDDVTFLRDQRVPL